MLRGARIFPVDREAFGFSYWPHTTVHVPPERYFWDEMTLEEAAWFRRRQRWDFHFALKVRSPRRRKHPDPLRGETVDDDTERKPQER